MKSATIFGGGSKDRTTKEYIETEKIGELLAQSGYKVKSGGYYGIMEATSKGSTESGGISIGFTCKTFPSTKGNTFLSKTIVCDDIYDRLRSLIESSDLFIVQRGGIGTLSELFLTMDVS